MPSIRVAHFFTLSSDNSNYTRTHLCAGSSDGCSTVTCHDVQYLGCVYLAPAQNDIGGRSFLCQTAQPYPRGPGLPSLRLPKVPSTQRCLWQVRKGVSREKRGAVGTCPTVRSSTHHPHALAPPTSPNNSSGRIVYRRTCGNICYVRWSSATLVHSLCRSSGEEGGGAAPPPPPPPHPSC